MGEAQPLTRKELIDKIRKREQPPIEPSRPRNDWDWTSNGCNRPASNGHWVDCCNEHDLCYSFQGHTGEGKAECDELFRKCLEGKKGPSRLYYAGVKVAGFTGARGDPIYVETPRETTFPGYKEVGRCTFWFVLRDITYINADAGHKNWKLEFGSWPGEVDDRESFHLELGQSKSFPSPTILKPEESWCGKKTEAILYIHCPTTEMGRLFFFDVCCDGRKERYEVFLPLHDRPAVEKFRINLDLVTVCHQAH